MSLPKAQLVDPQGNMNLPGMTATGIVTASSLKGVTTGSATGLTGNPDLDVGIVTASSFVGQGDGHAANLTGTPQLSLGIATATSFVGDAVGKAAGLTGTPNLNVGLITATSFVGFVTGDVTGNITGDVTGNITGNIQGDVEGNVTGNVSGLAGALGINGINVWTGAGTSNLGVGVCTATLLYGDGSGLTGAGSSAYIAQNINATGAETIIDLSYGNLIYYTSSSNTTVGFASTSAAEQITFIRDTGNDYTITWPNRVRWNNNTTPTLVNSSRDTAVQVFRFTTVDTGLNYNAWEEMMNDPTFTAGPMFGWGRNQRGLNGQNDGPGNVAARSSPVQIPGSWKSIDYGKAINADGKIFTWGENNYGMGLNDRTSRSSPTQVGTDTTWQYAGKGGAVKTDGSMWQWGYNQTGNLGDNTVVNRSSPTQVGTDTTWTQEWSGGNQHRVAIKSNGTLWTWGDNSDRGQLGQNIAGSPGSRSSPIQVGSGTDWSKVGKMFGGYGCAAIKTNGTLWVWGNNGAGALGLSQSVTGLSSPTQVPGTTWKAISMIGSFTGGVATKTDGSLWSWGYNSQGTLGQNTGGPPGTNRSSPIQVGTDNDWDQPLGALGGYGGGVTCRKTDGTLWVWGSNSYGDQGLNDRVARSSPTQLPGEWEKTAGSGNVGILGIKYSS